MYTTSTLSIYSEILTFTLKQLKPIKYKLKSIGSVIFMPRTLQTRLWRMKTNIFCFILIALLGITISTSIAQENEDVPKTNTEVEKLKIQFQTVENEKMEAETKLAEANTKLINAEFGKFERELRDSNNKWLWGWTGFFVGVVAIIGIAFWFSVRSLIADRVEKSLNGFKEAVEKVNILEDQFRILRIDNAASLLEEDLYGVLIDLERQPERIKALPEEVLLEVFGDKTRDLAIRYSAIEVLASRKSPLLVSPVLNYLNFIIDTEIDWGASTGIVLYPFLFFDILRKIENEETYQGLKTFFNRLIDENPKNRNTFLSGTIFSLSDVGLKLDRDDSVDMLKKVIPDLNDLEQNRSMLEVLVAYFDKYEESEGIKDILTNGLTDNMPEVEEKCLELLEKYNPDFVKEWKEQKEDTNTESENTE